MARPPRQDYIARIRYQNNLPPPPCPPKLLDFESPLESFTSAAFLSSLVQQQPLNLEIDSELGMPLDLTVIPGVFDKGDESKLYPERNPPPMHPKDRLLLRDPSSLNSSIKSQPGVSFLRRTEYISTDAVKLARAQRQSAAQAARDAAETITDPRDQIREIEESFLDDDEDLSKLVHPTKSHLKVEKSWEVVPDVDLFDLKYLLMKMAGSAPGKTSKDETTDPRYDVAIARPIGNETQTFMSFFLANEDTAKTYKQKITLSEQELDEEKKEKEKAKLQEDNDSDHDDSDNSNEETYRFEHSRDYELSSHSVDEVTLAFDDDAGKVYFHPVESRIVLKRRRVIQDVKKNQKEKPIVNDISAIEIKFRDLTGEEKVDRDSIRRTEYGHIRL
ncbi:RNA polymerase II-associated [Lipomyces japonicus]|uniref:RNA polymerase II-associated n=1 Tax=Lipomyces japonicus TaxID=56871 RepID=UPI0034CE66A4